MFNREFYPTPTQVIDQMGIDCYGKVVLEPQAGAGNIVDWLKENGASEIIACEKDERLRAILANKCRVISNDFFQVKAEDISHVQLIVMNPPFSNADEHILHAFEIAPEGCEIISLCNKETLRNTYSRARKQLERLIDDYGDDSVDLSSCFQDAERKTDVEVTLVRLFKPVISDNYDYEGFFFEQDQEGQENGIITHNEIRAVVNSYVAALKCFERFAEIKNEMSQYTGYFGFGNGLCFQLSYDKNIFTKEEFAREMQKYCWDHVFKKMKIEKWVTSGVMKDINRFINNRKNYPFTMRNVYRMLEIIVGTKEQTMNKAIAEAIDNLTKYTHENRYGLPGWKTNAGHLLNKKFIVDYIVEQWTRSYNIRHNGRYEQIRDLTKALCYLTGKNYDDTTQIIDIFERMQNGQKLSTNQWYCAGFFEFKFFKKGTMHIKFQNDSDWELLNKAYAKIKGQVLPENCFKASKSEAEYSPKYEESLFI